MPTDTEAAAEFRKARDAATPGPWEVLPGRRVVSVCPCCGLIATCTQFGADPECSNAGFIAAARSCDLPERIDRLVAEVAELRSQLSMAESQRDLAKAALARAVKVTRCGPSEQAKSNFENCGGM